MKLISQLLSKLEPPVFSVGEVKTSPDNKWDIKLEQYKNENNQEAYRFNFFVPYDTDTKLIQGQQGEQGRAATISIGTVTTGAVPSVTNVGTPTDAVLDFVLPQGFKGERGEVGPQGPMGIKGQPGEKGETGKAPIVKVGEVDYSETGLVRVTGRYEDRSDGSQEVFIDFHFPKAIMNGGAGIDGKDGRDATIAVGEVTQGDIVRIKNVGTPTNAILDFVLPAGIKGDRGDKGEKGDRGKSAYEAAVEYGFLGSEELWVQSLKGERGSDGQPLSLNIGTVTVGAIPTVSLVKKSDTNYDINFVLPDTVVINTDDMKINASQVVFSDNESLQDKFDKKAFTDKVTALPVTDIGEVALTDLGKTINSKIDKDGMSVVQFSTGENQHQGLWIKYNNASVGLYFNDIGTGLYLDIGSGVEEQSTESTDPPPDTGSEGESEGGSSSEETSDIITVTGSETEMASTIKEKIETGNNADIKVVTSDITATGQFVRHTETYGSGLLISDTEVYHAYLLNNSFYLRKLEGGLN